MHQNNTSDWQSSLLPEKANSTSSSSDKDLEWKVTFYIDVVILVAGLVGNSFVLLVVNRNMKKQKTLYECLICNLSLSDLGFVFTMLIYSYFKVPRSNFYCRFFVPSLTVTLVASMYTVIAIALFRCRAILSPFKLKPTKKIIYGTIAVIWLCAHIEVIPLYLVSTYTRNFSKFGYCSEVWPSQTYNKLYTMALFVVQYIIPLTIMAASYTKIVLYLKRHKIPQSGLDKDKTIQLILTRRRNIEVIKMSVIILLLYTILTLPFQIDWISVTVFENYKVSIFFGKFSHQLLLLHSCCNPVVYGSISREFRSQLVKKFCDIFCCIFRRSKVRIVTLYKEQGKTNNSLQELDINVVVMTSLKLERN